jgi:hypothetical protein
MGFYHCFNVECVVKPEYVEIIREFIKMGFEWDIVDGDEKYNCIKDWILFLQKHKKFSIYPKDAEFPEEIYYDNSPPCGLPSRWGQYCELIQNEKNENEYIWKFTGEMKNYNREIENFIQIVLVNMSSHIYQCWISQEGCENILNYGDKHIRSGWRLVV